MTPLQACQETKELWTKLAQGAREDRKDYEKWDIPGPWKDYRHQCPCCEYDKENGELDTVCTECPMEAEFQHYNEDSSTAFCESSKSPYFKWSFLVENGPCIDVEFFCLLMVELTQEAIDRIERNHIL